MKRDVIKVIVKHLKGRQISFPKRVFMIVYISCSALKQSAIRS